MILEEDLALNKPAWASYISPGDSPSKAVDNDPTTFAFSGKTVRPFVGIDLGSDVTIGRVRIMFGWGKYQLVQLKRTLIWWNVTFLYWCKTLSWLL